jgi:hypothetical protein
MPVATVYASVEELKSRLDITTSDAARDADLLDCLLAASRTVDGLTVRTFGQSASEARTFTAGFADLLPVDDLVSLTTVEADEDGDRVYETSWSATDYDLDPENAAARGEPYTSLRVTPMGTRNFPAGRRGVRVTGVWGWPAVPEAVREATLVLAIRLFKRRDAPLGVIAVGDASAAIRLPAVDPEAALMLAPYRRLVAWGGERG